MSPAEEGEGAAPSDPIGVFLVDDHRVVRSGLAAYLATEPGIASAAGAAAAAAGQPAARSGVGGCGTCRCCTSPGRATKASRWSASLCSSRAPAC